MLKKIKVVLYHKPSVYTNKMCSLSINALTIYQNMSRIVRKPAFCICKNKDADQLRGNCEADLTAKLISAFVFAIRIIQFLYYLNPKFQASSHLLWLYNPVCVGLGRKPRRPVFSQRGSYMNRTFIIGFCVLNKCLYELNFV